MSMQPLKLGVAYHGNRMTHHAREDMRDIMRNGFDIVVHMFSHTDWDRHKTKIKEMIAISKEVGLEVWIDNWGLAGPPGDKAHFLAYHPEAHQIYSDGQMDPIRSCFNQPSFRQFTKDWVDTVQEIGGETIFWDEPHLLIEEKDGKTRFSCCCPVCRQLFEEQYGYPMPTEINDDVTKFRLDSLASYFTEVCDYSAAKGIKNILCVMLGEQWGINLSTLDSLCSVEKLDNIGSDPYWLNAPHDSVYEFVYENTKKNLALSEYFKKDHNIWIQTYKTPLGEEEDIIQATEAAYDAGARTILAWGYYGSISNDYAAKNPEKVWTKTCEAFKRIREMERDRLLEENRAKYRK